LTRCSDQTVLHYIPNTFTFRLYNTIDYYNSNIILLYYIDLFQQLQEDCNNDHIVTGNLSVLVTSKLRTAAVQFLHVIYIYSRFIQSFHARRYIFTTPYHSQTPRRGGDTDGMEFVKKKYMLILYIIYTFNYHRDTCTHCVNCIAL